MNRARTLPAIAMLVALVVSLVVACGDDDTGEQPTPTPVASPTPAPSPTAAGLEQAAIWPAADTVFETPDQAAEDFVFTVLGLPPRLGEFQQGDSRSGEIEVLAPPETDQNGTPLVRSVLLLRQLGPDDGWFVIAAVSNTNVIASPESGDEVAPGTISVSGEGRGFEGLLVVEAFVVGDGDPVDQVITQGGSMEDTEPYEVEVDLGGAQPGDAIILLVRGGVGLENDPGDFSALPVVVVGD